MKSKKQMLNEYQISVKRSKRKTTSIYIERNGDITVRAPEQFDKVRVNKILKQNEYKIHKYQAKRILLNETAVKREPVNGQSFLYLGRNYYLQYSDKLKSIYIKGRYLLTPKSAKNSLRKMLKKFYSAEGKQFITPRVHKYAKIMCACIDEVAILDLKNRWASCSVKKPKVNFHWKIMMAPVSVIEYIIVHELAHFKYQRHNQYFWNEVDKVIPDYKVHVEWLRSFGASMDL